jgi:hypothetical protein
VSRSLRRLVLASILACSCTVGVGYTDGYDGDYPPDAYIATTVPYYYNGYATYYYGGYWYYRDGGHWRRYEQEPEALRQRRIQPAPMRHNFEPSMRSYRGAARGGWRGGHR